MPRRPYWVYILTNHARTLYIGVTNDLERRVREHREERTEGFTKRYHVHKLVHYEAFQYVHHAIAREKELKGWTRAKKVALIEVANAGWLDLAAPWFAPGEGALPSEGTTPRAS